MSTTEQDYYELLGVARNADDQEIKKAFRKLARELHPDVSEHPEAAVRFREISEAYEALSNPETRQLYDRFGHAGLRSGGFTPTHFDLGDLGDLFATFFGNDLFGGREAGRANGADVGAEVEIDLAEAARGVSKTVRLEVAVSCGTCSGSGVTPGTEVADCRRCGGAGRLQQISRSVFGEFVRATTCPDCRGTGRVAQHPCVQCEGGGRRVEERELAVDIPAGIHHGQRIRITGEGHAGALGGRPGDVYVGVNPAGRDQGPAREGHARAPGLRPRRPAHPRQRHGPAPPQRRATGPAGGLRPPQRRAHLPARRRVLLEAQERVSLIRASVTVPREGAEELRARFVELAPEGFEEHESEAGVELAAYADAAERVCAAFPRARVSEVEPGWEDRWREFHRPARIGPLWIGPPWEIAPADAIAVTIDPGRAFGTGAHATTRLCLELLLAAPRGSVLDVGCGSGVLAIAAARLGFGPVTAVDSDELAVAAARANATANGVSIEVRRLDALARPLPESDLALINIELAPVRALGSKLTAAHVITAGYLAADNLELPGYESLRRLERDGWAADLFARRCP